MAGRRAGSASCWYGKVVWLGRLLNGEVKPMLPMGGEVACQAARPHFRARSHTEPEQAGPRTFLGLGLQGPPNASRSCPASLQDSREFACRGGPRPTPSTPTFPSRHITLISMLAARLSRAQLQLQSHRTWLRSFGQRATIAPTSASLTQHAIRPASTRTPREPAKIRKSVPRSGDEGRRAGALREAEEAHLVAQQRAIREASKNLDLHTAITIYWNIKRKELIIDPVRTSLTQAIAFWTRVQQTLPEAERDEATAKIVSDFVQAFIPTIKSHKLVRLNGQAVAHILRYLTATKSWEDGNRLWSYLRDTEGGPVDANVYGAAIEMLAAQDAKLEDLEALYETGLAKLPHSEVISYQLSPGSILPDRERDVAFQLAGQLPFAIMLARLMRGDAQNAYHILDSMLKLRPSKVDSRFNYPFLEERPISEAYSVFAMSCKAGNPVRKSQFRALLSALRQSADLTDARRYALTVKAMLTASYIQLGAGGTIPRNGLTEIIIVLADMLRIEGISALRSEQKLQLAASIQRTFRKVLDLADRYDVRPTVAGFNSMITQVAGLGRPAEVVTEILREAQKSNVKPTLVTRRSILVAAGTAGDTELIKKAWGWLVEARASKDEYPDTTDLHILVNACVATRTPDLVHKAISEMSYLDESERDNAISRLEADLDAPSSTTPPADFHSLVAEIAGIEADVDVFEARTRDNPGVQDFSAQHVPMLLFTPPKDVQLPESEMRKLYDDLTTDSAAPSPSADAEAAKGPPVILELTKMPLGQLRYENWKLITYLLAEADRHDKAYIDAVDAAIASGQRPPQRGYTDLFRGDSMISGVGLSEPPQEFVKQGEEVDVEKVRRRIMELRKVSLPAQA